VSHPIIEGVNYTIGEAIKRIVVTGVFFSALAIFVAFEVRSCNEDLKASKHAPKRWSRPAEKISVVITRADGDSYVDCVNRGGTWVTGDDRYRSNVLTGCIEPEGKF